MTDADRDDVLRELENAFTDLAGVVRRAHIESAERVSPGLAPTAYKTFAAIHRHGPISLSELAHLLGADKGLLSRTVTELDDLGLIERTQSATDRRMWLIAATETGAHRLEAARRSGSPGFRAVLEQWPLRDLERFTQLLRALVDSAA